VLQIEPTPGQTLLAQQGRPVMPQATQTPLSLHTVSTALHCLLAQQTRLSPPQAVPVSVPTSFAPVPGPSLVWAASGPGSLASAGVL
jgi:hypothetical protein